MSRGLLALSLALPIAATAPAFTLSTTDPGTHFGFGTLFSARGIAQPSNFKWQLRRSGEAPGLTANPGSGNWWNATRSWRLSYDQPSNRFTWDLWTDGARTGTPISSLNRTDLVPNAGRDFVGLRIGVRAIDATLTTVSVSDVLFNGAAISTMPTSLTSSATSGAGNLAGTNHFFSGPVQSFTLEGVTTMSWTGSLGSSSSDRVAFDVTGLQGEPVPEPATLGALALGAAVFARLRRRTAR